MKATAKKGKVIVTRRPPTNTCDGFISGYQVRVDKGAWTTQTRLRVDFTSLRSVQKVVVHVKAVNEAEAALVGTVRSAAKQRLAARLNAPA